ncbi:MAG: hypothetical protein SGBAC_008374 [Bacillariaceae sp.]
MPQGKKKNKGGRPRNNKQKRGAGHGKNSHRRPAGTKPTKNLPLRPEHALEGSAPSYQGFSTEALHENYPSIYARYKAATNRVFQYMQDHAPSKNSEESKNHDRILMNVNSLVTAADWMEENHHAMDPSILKDLKLAIRVRSRVAKSVFGGGDSGHRHLLTVLVYCWRVLASLPKSKEQGIEKDIQDKLSLHNEDTPKSSSRNQYEAFQDEESDEENAIEEDLFPSKPVPRPDPIPEPMSLEDLMQSDDRHDVTLFLHSINELMHPVEQQYAAVARKVNYYKSIDVSGSAIVGQLTEAAVAANMAIQKMMQLEMDFEAHHPQISTPYRVLSYLAFPEVIKQCAKTVREHGQIPCPEQEITLFLGDCLECGFRSPSDPQNRRLTIVSEFCQLYEINSQGSKQIQDIFDGISQIIGVEVPVGPERDHNRRMMIQLNLQGANYHAHSWIPPNMPFIAGDRAIHHTIRLLQNFGLIASGTPENEAITARRNCFGPSPWLPGRARTIHNDLDELLMADILPQWFLLCRNGILGKADLPRQNEIAPFWVCMKNFFNAPEKPVRWSSVFAVHAMLTAIFETDKVTNAILSESKAAYDLYFGQLDKAYDLKKKEVDTSQSPAFKQNMPSVMFLKNFGLPVFGDRAIWNPLCGGTVFSYISLFGNLEAGCASIDDRAQLRIVLHLYHGLIANNILQRGIIPMLDILHDGFKNSRAIWEGPLPKKGQFVERFWVSFGASRGYAADMAKQSSELLLLSESKRQENSMVGKSYRSDRRKMTVLEPAEVATSFRRICYHDFHDVVDKYHTPEQRQRGRGTDYYAFAVQMNDTLDAIEEEHPFRALNLPACGVYLEQFVCSLSRVFQWDPILVSAQLQQSDLGQDKRQGAVYIFAQYLLGALDCATDPLNFEYFGVPQGLASSSFMSQFFNRVPPTNLIWYQAVKET